MSQARLCGKGKHDCLLPVRSLDDVERRWVVCVAARAEQCEANRNDYDDSLSSCESSAPNGWVDADT